MNEVMKNILERRSIRHFRPERIKPEELEQILQAGLWAPNAGGRQLPIMLVCNDYEINEQLGRINRAVFGEANSDGINFVSKTQKSIADDKNIKNGFYCAPTVITLFATERWMYAIPDCSIAAESILLAAWSLGIGGCYVTRAEETFESEVGKKLMARAGIEDYYKARVCVCLGYPDGEIGEGKPRKEGRVKQIG